ncbi:rare lipoprotein A [Kaistia dalseonensis]|uniref:Endolytic peptidoglycan transglycosylase RlpA n=1 Tax=Kaistia dalseonensis TaxID=410840 RepID=A0ABU0H2Q1_9HYPH|nr:septal ring lytic transglycosylase RlpA family protein [Kaistia dalseonensis]MDQ0436575.1 rare lipoprotein A [Kaistia dalseonensis]
MKASPKVVEYGQPVPQGGGRYMVGKAYTVKGRVYKPAHDPRYESVGYASWYGSAFHGRRTANGEVYDMDMLSAAHPTMPLPSYARVTNLRNGSSVVVRVNDRGPFERDRVIDLSSRTAELLEVKGHGTAKVKVEYVGPARMEGHDKQMLLATYVGPGSTVSGDTMLASLKAPRTTPTVAVAMAAAPVVAPRAVVAMASAPVPRARPEEAYVGDASFDPYHFQVAAAAEANRQVAVASAAPAAAVYGTQAADNAALGTTYGERTLGTYTTSQPVAYSSEGIEPAAVAPAKGYYYAPTLQVASARSSYASDAALTPAQEAANALAIAPARPDLQSALNEAVARIAAERRADLTIIQVGVFSDQSNVAAISQRLAAYGRVTGTSIVVGGRPMESVQLVVTDRALGEKDAMAVVAEAGAPGAYILTR